MYLGADNSEATCYGLNDGHAECLGQAGVEEDVTLNQKSITNVTVTDFAQHLEQKQDRLRPLFRCPLFRCMLLGF